MKAAKLIFSLMTVWLIAACSSSPERRTADTPTSQQEYAKDAEKRLSQWSDRADDLKGDLKDRMQAAIRDARIELDGLRTAGDAGWHSYHERLEGAFDHIEDLWSRRKASE